MQKKHRQFKDTPLLQKKQAMARYIGQSRRFNRQNRESPWYGEWSEVLYHRVVDFVDNALLIPQLTLLYETTAQLAEMLQKKKISSTNAPTVATASGNMKLCP
jgi:hypothetical protein